MFHFLISKEVKIQKVVLPEKALFFRTTCFHLNLARKGDGTLLPSRPFYF
jgi:hypothetical protein